MAVLRLILVSCALFVAFACTDDQSAEGRDNSALAPEVDPLDLSGVADLVGDDDMEALDLGSVDTGEEDVPDDAMDMSTSIDANEMDEVSADVALDLESDSPMSTDVVDVEDVVGADVEEIPDVVADVGSPSDMSMTPTTCDPEENVGCPPGEDCFIVTTSGGVQCRPTPHMPRLVQMACNDTTPCAAGLVCAYPTSGGILQCRALCSQSSDCSSPEVCRQVGSFPAGLGVCLPPTIMRVGIVPPL